MHIINQLPPIYVLFSFVFPWDLNKTIIFCFCHMTFFIYCSFFNKFVCSNVRRVHIPWAIRKGLHLQFYGSIFMKYAY